MLSTGTKMRVPIKRVSFMSLNWSRFIITSTKKGVICERKKPEPLAKWRIPSKMGGWQLHSYGGIEELQYSDKLKVPQIRQPNECLVRVFTTAVNPIDVAMASGYGAKFLNTLRCKSGDDIEFPLTLGREFCGQLVQKGMRVVNRELQLGARVWGVIPIPNIGGAHAEYVVVPEKCMAPAPTQLDNREAASVLYAGLTAWSGLYISAFLGGPTGAMSSHGGSYNQRVLVLGGSGSVGSLAIQIMKSQGCQIVATCSEDATEMVHCFGADHVVDYKNPAQMEELSNYAPYDIVLDCAGQGVKGAEALNFEFDEYVTFSSAFLTNIDNRGYCIGTFENVGEILQCHAKTVRKNSGSIKYGFFYPAAHGIEFLQRLVKQRRLVPQIDSVYKFDEMPKAFCKVKDGHLRGKVVVSLED